MSNDLTNVPGAARLLPRRGDYGLDGDYEAVSARTQAIVAAVILTVLIALTIVFAVTGVVVGAVLSALVALRFALFVGSFLYTTRTGKYQVWERILTELPLRGNERVLDMGCGRGAIMFMAAELVPAGRTVGIDIWQADQTGNGPESARHNAELEGVAGRIELVTGDMTRMPFSDNEFDLIISNIAIHNIPDAAGRRAAVEEAFRVLRPGGRLVVADLAHTNRYRARLAELGMVDLARRSLGWRMWWGTPLLTTRLLTGTKPVG
ncbi:class I SAM-dependent methyltransferase [Nocardia macrotermitis]|uniref:Ubiquinone/menaquinone biosynthesis C-methyltransferase UbiE n=1 Tax=Nocardia macrotermitis TaxID=2585198 RepID=A0A7K0CXX9_9NOCA|nr:class I SAM-dependent methyltransferase [Nocardia macrotermitis]MQY18268.1 Ubiquinone/menaquinone biosynthesis C-methyltransferase UbiE [Nocardia macrotermitis]